MFSFSSVTGPPPNPQRVGVFAEGNAPVIGRLQNPTAELTFGLLADKASRRFGSGVAALLGAGRLLQAGGVLIIFEGPGEPQIVIMPSGRRATGRPDHPPLLGQNPSSETSSPRHMPPLKGTLLAHAVHCQPWLLIPHAGRPSLVGRSASLPPEVESHPVFPS
ncbi:hypothetical protein EYR38_002996 [Pleurotus pulmonarius]|nr:hypothetical protein EYR38_002996 [Pleurotus pulmonarius]